MAFSGALTITDLDDFLTPSQACIIPVRNGKAQSDLADGSTEIHIDGDNNYYEVSTYSTSVAGPSSSRQAAAEKKALERAEINLNDCLACSGCITSTESLLITLQSHSEVLSFIAASQAVSGTANGAGAASKPETRTPVLSISPQTLASLSAHYAAATSRPPLPLLTLLRRIRSFLSVSSRGAWRVVDTTFARHLSLRESVREFDERRSAAKGKWVARDGVPVPGPLPVLASACPGWVCYAEKAQGDLLPLLSSVRSSQAVVGALVKQWWGAQLGIRSAASIKPHEVTLRRTKLIGSPSEIYHVTAMPCYDKKLEASRSDFYSSVHATRDVDCVLTTGELDLLLQDLAFDPYQATASDTDEMSGRGAASTSSSIPWPELLDHPGTSSGSYLHTIISHIARSHPGPTAIHIRKIRDSADNEEYILYDQATGVPLFKGAKVYGFRNLQNLVRRVGKETGLGKGKGAGKLGAAVAARRRKARTGQGEVSTPQTPGTPGLNGGGAEDIGEGLERMKLWEEKKLDYVEVMACPSGCVNGGGQMKPVGSVGKASDHTNDTAQVGTNASNRGMEVDEEGYPRPMPDEGVEIPGPPPKLGQTSGQEGEEGWRWSTKEWVAKVEDLYWTGLPTPPASPRLSPVPNGTRPTAGGSAEEKRTAAADKLAEDIDQEIVSKKGDAGRWEFLRTRFRKVEGDVLSQQGGVTLEAVKW